MATYRTEDEVQQEHLAALGPALGPLYHQLWVEFEWAHIRWAQYRILYGMSPQRIDLLNRAAGLFFRVLQETSWEQTLLDIGRLSDPPESRGKPNLTIQALPAAITDETLRNAVKELVDDAVKAATFARDWRNRRIAHRDLALVLGKPVEPLSEASRAHVEIAFEAIGAVLNEIGERLLKSGTAFGALGNMGDATTLLYVLREGVAAQDAARQRLRDGVPREEDLAPKDPI